MSKQFATTEEYRAALLWLGEMVHSRKPDIALREHYDAFCGDEEASEGIFPAFGILREAFELEPPEAMCVALWLYRDASPLPPLTTDELLECCRRIGGRPPRQVLSRLFVADGERAVLHPIAADFLMEREPRLPQGVELSFPPEAEPSHATALFRELTALLEGYAREGNPFPLLIALCGEEGSGRRFLIKRLCRQIGAALLRVDMRAAAPVDDLLSAAVLYGACLCLEHTREPEAIGRILDHTGFAFAIYDDCPPVGDFRYTVFAREMPGLEERQCQSFLRDALKGVPAEDDVIPDPLPHALNIGRIGRIANSLRAESMAAGKPVGRPEFLRVLREQSPVTVQGAESFQCPGGLRDIVLPDELERQLAELCAFVQKRDTVYKTWGFEEKIPWGRGISALFYGAPGTGKTMAAAIVANEVGLPLLRVDISQLMSKYIGETQKNIGKIFDGASKNNCILFFDEADAVFARRTESADAQDKYANAETAYLLQRIEGHDGVCILATNLLQNFDEAFRRRIRYMLHFPLPDAVLRERIWRGVFPAGAPTEELDYHFLARQLELSGASIKNCVVHAAYLAAIGGTAITMSHIMAGAKNEYAKLGKTLSPQIAQMISTREDAL